MQNTLTLHTTFSKQALIGIGSKYSDMAIEAVSLVDEIQNFSPAVPAKEDCLNFYPNGNKPPAPPKSSFPLLFL